MAINRKGYIEMYERNERQRERLECARERMDILKDIRSNQEILINSDSNFLVRTARKVLHRLLMPYIEQQRIISDNAIDMMDLLYGISEDAVAESTSMLAWSGFDKREVERKRVLESKREIIENSSRRVLQIVSHLNFGDAVGNDVMAIRRALEEAGITTAIYTYGIHKKLPLDVAFYMDDLPELNSDDIIIYHFANKDPLRKVIEELECKKIIRYHNVTPPEFFEPYDEILFDATAGGLKQIKKMNDVFDFGMVDSKFNRQDLIQMGFECPIDVVPILIPFDEYKQEPSQEVINKYKDDWTNIIFVGRIAPNKKIEDVIASYHAYKKRNPKSRLLLVGNYDKKDLYYKEVAAMVKDEQIEDVIFTGHISFADILAYYSVADVFLCMSEHEGFCVPLVEAMFFELPIIAYNSTAIPYTMGNAGILIDSKEPEEVAQRIEELVNSPENQKMLQNNARAMLETYQYETIKEKILACISKYRD